MIPLAGLYRVNLEANVARFYRVGLEGPDLFDQVAVVRQWGRIGSPRGQELRTYHPTEGEAEEAAARVIAAKRRKGYQDGLDQSFALPAPHAHLSRPPGPLLAHMGEALAC